MLAYLAELNRLTAAPEPVRTKTLEDRFAEWFDSLPAATRNRPYSMLEIERALGTQGRYISPIMVNRGWTRKRQWRSTHYWRLWLPPGI